MRAGHASAQVPGAEALRARLRAAGYADLTVDQIIRLHDHGVD